MSSTAMASIEADAASSEDDVRRTCEHRDQIITSLLFSPPPNPADGDPADLRERLHQQLAELETVLHEKEAELQTLRLKARFTNTEETRLQARHLLQESARLELALEAKRAQRGGARDPDVAHLDELRRMRGVLESQRAQRQHRQAQREEAARSAWDALGRCAARLTHGLEQLEQARGAGEKGGRGRTYHPRSHVPVRSP